MSASGYSKTEIELVGQCRKGWLADLFVKYNYFIFDEKREIRVTDTSIYKCKLLS